MKSMLFPTAKMRSAPRNALQRRVVWLACIAAIVPGHSEALEIVVSGGPIRPFLNFLHDPITGIENWLFSGYQGTANVSVVGNLAVPIQSRNGHGNWSSFLDWTTGSTGGLLLPVIQTLTVGDAICNIVCFGTPSWHPGDYIDLLEAIENTGPSESAATLTVGKVSIAGLDSMNVQASTVFTYDVTISSNSTMQMDRPSVTVQNLEIQPGGTLWNQGYTTTIRSGLIITASPGFSGSLEDFTGTVGGSIFNAGHISILGSAQVNGDFSNSGSVIVKGSSALYASEFDNQPTGVTNFAGDVSGLTATSLINHGLITKSAGTGTSVITATFFDSFAGSTLNVSSGTLVVGNTNATFRSGSTTTADAGSVLAFTGSNVTLQDNTQLMGLGQTRIENGNLYVQGAVNSTNLILGNGTYYGTTPTDTKQAAFTGTVKWRGGTMNNYLQLAAGSSLTTQSYITGDTSKFVAGTLDNRGTIKLQEDGFYLSYNSSGSSLINQASGVIDFAGDTWRPQI